GFMDGDFITMLYAWAPNWKSLTVGHDNYNLYARRSFDGGKTWTTTPATLGGDGTTHCETYRDRDKSNPDSDNTTLCFTYSAGEFEQARDLSRFQTVHLTVLDPRYTPTAASIFQEDGTFLYPDDQRDHSKFVITYETGDNTTTAEGEPEPLDMFYGRAYNWGDDYELFVKPDEEDPENPSDWVECNPADLLDPTNLCSFDWLENHNDVASSEATLRANSAGNFFYAVWAEFGEAESDIGFRRIMWYFDDTGMSDDPQDVINDVYQLSVNVTGAGSGYVLGDYLGDQIITCGSAGHDCKQTLADGEVVDVEAYPDQGSVFEGWQGDVVSTDPFLTIPMTEDRFLTAVFQPEPTYVCTQDHLVVTDMLCTGIDLLVACETIEVQGTSLVTSTGDLTMVAGGSIAFDYGFVVDSGGKLEVLIDPDM
ncbi:MAG: hypothetical protein HKN01_07525, partial [Acidimicrobiia bacterium]|nr:hypothetical protein [Acidimicrobiia bacterium]